MRPAPAALLVPLVATLLLTGCSGGGSPEAGGPSGSATSSGAVLDAAALSRAEALALAEGTVAYEAETTRTRLGEETTVEGRLKGAVDLKADTGRAELDLVSLREIEEQSDTEPSGIAQLKLTWTATTLTGTTPEGETSTSPREVGSAGLITRVPDEVRSLLSVLDQAEAVEVVGTEDVDGTATTRFRATLPAEATVDAGVGLDASAAIRELDDFGFELWLDGRGLPRQARITIVQPPQDPLPQRTLVTTYSFTKWGDPI